MQQFADASCKPRQIEWLGEKIVGLHGHGAFGDFTRERAHENDRNLFCGRLAAQDFTNGQAVKIGQQNIKQDQIRLKLPCLTQRLHAVAGDEKFAAKIRKTEFHQLDEIRFVVHNQDTRHHAARSASSTPTAMTGGLKPRDEMETEKI